MPKKVVLLGATGSIGSSTLDVIRHYKEEFELLAVSGRSQEKRLQAIIEEFSPRYAALPTPVEWMQNYPKTEFVFGAESLNTLASLPEADIVVMALSGLSGLLPTIQAILAQKHLLSANKEAIVAAGPLINDHLNATGKSIIPLDSEHNALFLLTRGFESLSIHRLVLTASGGPFYKNPATPQTTIKDVLRHPTWNMGSYITVNSATMLNKGFEVIEAHYLFRRPFEEIDVLIHPQSLVHGIVELTDGTCVMVASPSDMRYPISFALFHPKFPPQPLSHFSLTSKPLEFHEVPRNRFPLLWLAYEVGKSGGMLPLALNALNEEIVEAFLSEKIRFIDIENLIQKGIDEFIQSEESRLPLSLENLPIAEQKARFIGKKLIGA